MIFNQISIKEVIIMSNKLNLYNHFLGYVINFECKQ